jgi:hypothetical protein
MGTVRRGESSAYYRREDGWSIYLADETLLISKLCQPDGKVAASPSGFPLESIGRLAAWADELVAKIKGTL